MLLTSKVWLILNTSGYYVVKKFEFEISNNIAGTLKSYAICVSTPIHSF